ncbi:hypothetical protein LOZ12_002373 [Ophidiomyces ophidiicola]|uniref:Uncharacterized protein n=1 Tax=Ophidiomyces ophidiicola TaxID=1387563 RepID=A0ACB8UXK6_9EURO|nr:hypothetical protein LOZ62_003773 [Ophidiomyces ophidiicola]KAI1972319.1 hypothetical protein LOZ56_002536 [Ophidiomyces ophidiicola]KAI2005869.1 hypothetical protein LOZ50_003405 [Ophidiomyces ophidiicola]KAI2032958.1 hypothetical protein LOZ48_002214 [Ophidiomyces ophidiicola]KAI2038416.1 hypothetical protein LOZ47_003189 [Ophidiomyces ophidiicola]
MSDYSDPLSSADIPDEASLKKALQDAVARIFKSGKMEDLTVKRVRLAAEKSLGLQEGFYKGDAIWKAKSDTVIKDEVEAQERLQEQKEKKRKATAPEKPSTSSKAKQAKRIPGNAKEGARKKRKQTTPSENEEELPSPLRDMEETLVGVSKKASRPTKPEKVQDKNVKEPTPVKDSISEQEDTKSEPDEEPKHIGTRDDEPASESEMSVVLDEAPKPKKKRETAPKKSKSKTKTPALNKDANLDPDQAEIKRLQGWLIKCGIRKMWARELAPFDTSKAKIRHLKDMLKDAGMDGRYSLEKARVIREERELKADLETVQEGAKRWGKKDSGDEEAGGPSTRRRLARGFRSLGFLDDDDDDGEESG